MSNTSKLYSYVIFLLIIAVIPYLNVFDVPYYFDDYPVIQQNPFIRDINNYFSKKIIDATFAANPEVLEDTRNSFITRPLPYFTFTIEFYLHGLQNLFISHSINLFIHLVNTILVFLIIRQILSKVDSNTPNLGRPIPDYCQDNLTPFLTAALFAVHPLMTNAVSYLVQRMTSIMSLFYLATILFYLHSRGSGSCRRLFYTLALITSICAMLSKEAAVTIPFLLLTYELLFRSLHRGTIVARILPFFLTCIIPLYNVAGLQNSLTKGGNAVTTTANLINFNNYGYIEHLLTQCKVILFYWKLLLWPTGLALEHQITPEQTLANPLIFSAFLIHLSLISFCAIHIFKATKVINPVISLEKVCAYGISWFYLTISIEAGLIPLNDLAVEYRLYLPSIGVFLCAVVLIQRFFVQINQRILTNTTNGWPVALTIQKLNGFFWAIVLITLASITFSRNQLWRNPENFWKNNIALYPTIARVYANLADHYIRSGKPNDAILVYRNAISNIPNNSYLFYQLGNSYILASDYSMAIATLTTSIMIKPEYEPPYYALAKAYALSGSYNAAINVISNIEQRKNYLGK